MEKFQNIQDFTVRRLIAENLEYWKDKKWKRDNIKKFFEKYNKNKRLIFVEINFGKISYTGYGKKRKNAFASMNKVLQAIVKHKKYNNLQVSFLISLNDEAYHRTIKTFDFRKHPNDQPTSHPFKWGVSQKSNDVCRIEKSSSFDLNIPLFSLNHVLDGNIIFPHENIVNNGFSKINDQIQFNDKRDKVIYRFSNIRADLNIPSRIKLVEMSYKNPDLLDCRGAKKGTHPGHDKYILQKVFLKVYRSENLIDKNLSDKDLDKMMEYYKVSNFMSKSDIIKNKYLICIDSWYNVCDYALVNSILFRYKLDKCKYYEDFIFEDNQDFFIFDEYNFKDRLTKVKYISNQELIKKIEIRKKKVKNYLKFEKLIVHYGQLLTEFSKIQKMNEI